MKELLNKGIIIILAIIFLIPISCIESVPKLEYEPNPDTTIPTDFVTYTNEGVFSVSYPAGWKEDFEIIEQSETLVEEWLSDDFEDQQLDEVAILFMAGNPVEGGLLPNVVVVMEPIPENIATIDELIESQVKGLRQVANDYDEQSRVKTTIDGRDAGIVEYMADFFGNDMISHNLVMATIVDDISWSITCTSFVGQGEFRDYEKEFYSILRSFRLLQS